MSALNPSALTRLDARAIATDVSSGRVSAVAIVRDVLARLAVYDGVQPQAWISRFDAEELIAAGEAVDARIAAGETLALAGVPFAVKDNIDVADIDTTAGCPSFAYRPTASATAVERLGQAGAICIGKTNLDQFATGLNGTRSPYGTPRNAYNLAYVSGGSSSGSSVVVAAGLVAFALGTDTAGSGRVPAAFNHRIGFKPSRGRWSNGGVVPACRTLDCVTVLATSVADAGLVDDVVAGFDPADAFSAPLTDRRRDARRIGVPRPDQRVWFGDLESERLYDRALDCLVRGGAEIVEIDMAPLNEAAPLLYGGPWVAERAAALEAVLAADPVDLDPVVRAVVSAGLGMRAVDLFNGIYRLAELRRAADMLWETIDLIVLPTTGTTYRVAEMHAAPIALNSNLGANTNFVNLLDMAAIAVPAGARQNGTGFGITLIGPAATDRALFGSASPARTARGRTAARHQPGRPQRQQEAYLNKRWAAMAIGGCVILSSASGAVEREQVLAVPGFAEFIAIDGDSVWVTNKGRVERWSREGKLADVAMAHPCGAMAIAAGSLWVADCEDKTLNRIDLKTAKTTVVIATGIASPDGEMNVVAGAGSIWVASDAKGVIARVDPVSNRVTASVAVNPDSNYLAFGSGSLWAVSGTQGSVQKIDPNTNAVVKTTKLGQQPGFLAAGEGAVWIQEQGDGTVARIDPVTGDVSGRIKVDETLKYGDVDTGGGKTWLRTTAGQAFVVIDPKSLAIQARVGKDFGSGALRYTPAGVWTSAHDLHTLSWWREPENIGD